MGQLDYEALNNPRDYLSGTDNARLRKRQANQLVGTRQQTDDDYRDWSWDDLYHYARNSGIKHCARMTHRELVKRIEQL